MGNYYRRNFTKSELLFQLQKTAHLGGFFKVMKTYFTMS